MVHIGRNAPNLNKTNKTNSEWHRSYSNSSFNYVRFQCSYRRMRSCLFAVSCVENHSFSQMKMHMSGKNINLNFKWCIHFALWTVRASSIVAWCMCSVQNVTSFKTVCFCCIHIGENGVIWPPGSLWPPHG